MIVEDAVAEPVLTDGTAFTDGSAPTDGTAEFSSVRGRLFGIAYRMLGTVADAEDVVQEAWVRWQTTDRSVVREPAAFLATTTTRLAINAATSAYARREQYVGPWLPEPVATTGDPLLGAERSEALSLAVLVLLERLTPTERAVIVLREAFDYPFRRIAEVLETSEANARQLARRARVQLAGASGASGAAGPSTGSGTSAGSGTGEHTRLLAAFMAAAQRGDLEALEQLLSGDAVATADGGGVVNAARRPVAGGENVARFLLGIGERFGQGATYEVVEVNGLPAVLSLREGEPLALVAIDTSDGVITSVFLVRNPEKLVRFDAR